MLMSNIYFEESDRYCTAGLHIFKENGNKFGVLVFAYRNVDDEYDPKIARNVIRRRIVKFMDCVDNFGTSTPWTWLKYSNMRTHEPTLIFFGQEYAEAMINYLIQYQLPILAKRVATNFGFGTKYLRTHF